MEASYHVNRTILNIFQHCILGGVIVTQELDSQLWIHLPHAHVTMTEQHMLGLEIGFLSLWLGVWYEYPLLVKHYVSSVVFRMGCKLQLMGKSQSFNRECIFISAVCRKTVQSLLWAVSLGVVCQEDIPVVANCMRSQSSSSDFPGSLVFPLI